MTCNSLKQHVQQATTDQTFDHVGSIFRSPLGLVVERIAALRLLKAIQDGRSHKTQFHFLLPLLHCHQGKLDLGEEREREGEGGDSTCTS